MKERIRRHASNAYKSYKRRFEPPHTITKRFLREIIAGHILTGGICPYCKKKTSIWANVDDSVSITIDHIVPGVNVKENVIVCCRKCNLMKGADSLQDFFLRKDFHLSSSVDKPSLISAMYPLMDGYIEENYPSLRGLEYG